ISMLDQGFVPVYSPLLGPRQPWMMVPAEHTRLPGTEVLPFPRGSERAPGRRLDPELAAQVRLRREWGENVDRPWARSGLRAPGPIQTPVSVRGNGSRSVGFRGLIPVGGRGVRRHQPAEDHQLAGVRAAHCFSFRAAGGARVEVGGHTTDAHRPPQAVPDYPG